jgi:hypothetical protein
VSISWTFHDRDPQALDSSFAIVLGLLVDLEIEELALCIIIGELQPIYLKACCEGLRFPSSR